MRALAALWLGPACVGAAMGQSVEPPAAAASSPQAWPQTGANAEPDATGHTLPLWEAGVGLGVLTAPAYLGSATRRTHAAPWPYFIYRGERFRAGRDGLSYILQDATRLSVALSLGGALPVKSAGTAREGMPDLPPLVEVGGVVKLPLVETEERYTAVHLPVRYGVGVSGDGIQRAGWIVDPTLRHTDVLNLHGQQVYWGVDLTLKMQSAGYNNFYYGVRPTEVTAGRAAYDARGGFAGLTVNTGLAITRTPWMLGVFVGWASIARTAFADSPLVERRNNLFGGVALTWIFSESAERVSERGVLAGR